MNACAVITKRKFVTSLTRAVQACIACAALFLSSCSPSPNRPIREADYSEPIRVACVGDSITFGYGFKNRERDSYRAQFQMLLSTRWKVMNFGFNGATLLKQGTKPFSGGTFSGAKQPQRTVGALTESA
jgi:hypothetical protein